MVIREILRRDPDREVSTVVKITDHFPQRVWTEMDEYVPTERVKGYFRDILDALLETRRGATEQVCIWVSGFFGSGKSHFLKVLGYLLEGRTLQDPDGNEHPSQEFLCRRLGLQDLLPLLQKEFRIKVLFINLLDYDPQSPRRPTLSRLVYRHLLEDRGLSTEFWVAAWEKELQELDRWEEFEDWVKKSFGREWERERTLNAEPVLKRALPELLPERYRTEEDALQAIQESKKRYSTINPSDVARDLVQEAKHLHEHNGRLVVLLDEVGLYIGDSVERLTDLNSLAEQVVQQGEGKVLLIATAQEALTDIVPRLTTDRQILEWLRDRFRLHLGLLPTEVEEVIAQRLLAKTGEGVQGVRTMFRDHEGRLRMGLSLEQRWGDDDFLKLYPCHPYAIHMMQDIMGAMRGSVEEARRLSGSERSLLKLVHTILRGEGGLERGAEKPLGWLISLDLFYGALAPDLRAVRSEQVRALEEVAQLGEVDGLPVVRIAKALFLLQHLRQRYPCSVENLASTLVDHVDVDIDALRQKVRQGLQKLQQEGWVVEEEGQYRLLTPAEHDLERDIRRNYPGPAEVQREAARLVREMLHDFRYEHGQIRRPLKVAMEVDGETVSEAGDLKISLLTPFALEDADELLARSIAEPQTLFWKAGDSPELQAVLERAIAIRKTLQQWQTRPLTREQEEHRGRLEREANEAFQTKLPELLRRAFLRGQLYLNGQELEPQGNDVEGTLRAHLRSVAGQLYTEFVDARPARDAECASILTWQPGAALPSIYTDLQLLTGEERIRRDAQLLSVLKSELQKRHNLGQDRSGRALLEHFERPPYGWDPRLVRLLLATLFKGGWAGVRYQGRDIADPTDPQARAVFTQAREFQRATFEVLPEVDWREASGKVSTIFGVQGGDTFERTAEVVRQQAEGWREKVERLATRCRDNELPSHFAQACGEVSETLGEIGQQADLNARLRRFLQNADVLQEKMPVVRNLESFNFEEYRKIRRFIGATHDWSDALSGDASGRWQRLRQNLDAEDLLGRWQQVVDDYAYLLSLYRNHYSQRHGEFRRGVEDALAELRRHEAFQHQPERAEELLQPLMQLLCEADGKPQEETFVCPRCRRSFVNLAPSSAEAIRRTVEAELDELLPPPPEEEVRSLRLERTLDSPSDVDRLAREVRRYIQRLNRPVVVLLEARPKEENDGP